MEYKPLPIGVENFEDMITNDYYYVDKTLFIKELIDKKGKVNLFTRPRRFGKTLTLSMVQYFFEKQKGSAYLFDGLNIMYAGEKYSSEINKYPVINITLKNVECSKYEDSFKMLRKELIREFGRHSYLLKSNKLGDGKKALYADLINAKATEEEYSSGYAQIKVYQNGTSRSR